MLPRSASARLLQRRVSRNSLASHKRSLALGLALLAAFILFTLTRTVTFRGSSRAGTLVVYIFRNSDPESANNLLYFLEQGIRPDDGAEYIITLADPEPPSPLPELPPNAQYAKPTLKCFETGMVGWVLWDSGLVDPAVYSYVVWLTSAARGPFLPVYVAGALPWHELLTLRLSGEVKLVGATISCAGVKVNPAHGLLRYPHVQPYLAATDQAGLRIIRAAGGFACTTRWLDHLRFGVVGPSEAVIRAGFTLDSLQLRYAGVDWRDPAKWACGAGIDPTQDGGYDGISVNPLEVVFVRMQHSMLVTRWPAALQAAKYDDWSRTPRGPGAEDITSNGWAHIASQRLDEARAHNPACFDADLYISGAPVEFAGFTREHAYEHFLAFGLREGRPYRFTC